MGHLLDDTALSGRLVTGRHEPRHLRRCCYTPHTLAQQRQMIDATATGNDAERLRDDVFPSIFMGA